MTRKARLFLAATVLFVASCSQSADYKKALVLTDDAGKHCDDALSEVASTWSVLGVNAVEEQYRTIAETAVKPIETRLEQARAVLSELSKGQERDLLFEHYAAADKLCGLVRSAEGYSLLTFTQRRSSLRDELAESRAKLGILVPVSDTERAAILAENTNPFEEEKRRSQRAAMAVAVAEAQRRQQEATDAAKRAAERKAFDDAERARLDREQADGTAQVHENDAPAKLVPPTPTTESKPPRSQAATPEMKAWFERSYQDLDRFCSTAAAFAKDLQASRFARYRECAVLRDSVTVLHDRLSDRPPPEISMPLATILESYEEGAVACLKKGELVTVAAFNEGQNSCVMLRHRLREAGLLR